LFANRYAVTFGVRFGRRGDTGVCARIRRPNVSEIQRLAEIYVKIGYDRQTVSEQLQRLPVLFNCYAACTDDRAGCACVCVRALCLPAVSFD
jgi:hypothetical protein